MNVAPSVVIVIIYRGPLLNLLLKAKLSQPV